MNILDSCHFFGHVSATTKTFRATADVSPRLVEGRAKYAVSWNVEWESGDQQSSSFLPVTLGGVFNRPLRASARPNPLEDGGFVVGSWMKEDEDLLARLSCDTLRLKIQENQCEMVYKLKDGSVTSLHNVSSWDKMMKVCLRFSLTVNALPYDFFDTLLPRHQAWMLEVVEENPLIRNECVSRVECERLRSQIDPVAVAPLHPRKKI